MKNAFLAKQQAIQAQCFADGMKIGEQFAIDCFQIALHKAGWGYDRIKRLTDAVAESSSYYADALRRGMEQDIRQEQMDRELRDIVKDYQEFIPFSKRYPDVKNTSYERLPKR